MAIKYKIVTNVSDPDGRKARMIWIDFEIVLLL